jgi:hypothetical protein
MKRDDWLEQMHAAVGSYSARTLRYGSQDCFQFVAYVVRAMSGVDYREKFPLYRGRRAAMRLLEQHGGVCGLISSVLGEAKPGPSAARGDVVAVRVRDQVACGVCLGTHCVTLGLNGLLYVTTDAALSAWSP